MDKCTVNPQILFFEMMLLIVELTRNQLRIKSIEYSKAETTLSIERKETKLHRPLNHSITLSSVFLCINFSYPLTRNETFNEAEMNSKQQKKSIHLWLLIFYSILFLFLLGISFQTNQIKRLMTCKKNKLVEVATKKLKLRNIAWHLLTHLVPLLIGWDTR